MGAVVPGRMRGPRTDALTARSLHRLGLAAVLLAATACSGDAPPSAEAAGSVPDGTATADSIIVVDASGSRVALGEPARRVVSLVPSATLTLDALGARDVLVGRTDYDTLAWSRSVPSVGGGLEPSVEAIVELQPDLVVRFGGEQDPRTPERLGRLGIAHLAIRPDGIDGVLEAVRLLGVVSGYTGAADSVVSAVQAELDAVAAAAQGRPAVRVAYVLGGTPPWVAGPGTYIDQLMALSGGVNVFDDLGTLYAAVSPEEFLTRDLQVVLLAEGTAFDGSLAPGARVVRIDGDVELPGPGVASAARAVAAALRPSGS